MLNDSRLDIYAGGRADIARGFTDVRVLVLLEYLAEAHGQVTVSSLTSGHGVYSRPGNVSAHTYGLAVDIAALEDTAIVGHQAPGGVTERAVRNILLLPAELQARQVISLLGLRRPVLRDGRPSRPHPRRLLDVVAARLERQDGSLVCERCLLAETPLARMRGLLGRAGLERGEGILLRPASSIHMWFMRFPIDAVFLERGRSRCSASPRTCGPGARPAAGAPRRSSSFPPASASASACASATVARRVRTLT